MEGKMDVINKLPLRKTLYANFEGGALSHSALK